MEVLLYQDKKNKVEEKEKNQYATIRTHSSWTVLNGRRSPRLLPALPLLSMTDFYQKSGELTSRPISL